METENEKNKEKKRLDLQERLAREYSNYIMRNWESEEQRNLKGQRPRERKWRWNGAMAISKWGN